MWTGHRGSHTVQSAVLVVSWCVCEVTMVQLLHCNNDDEIQEIGLQQVR